MGTDNRYMYLSRAPGVPLRRAGVATWSAGPPARGAPKRVLRGGPTGGGDPWGRPRGYQARHQGSHATGPSYGRWEAAPRRSGAAPWQPEGGGAPGGARRPEPVRRGRLGPLDGTLAGKGWVSSSGTSWSEGPEPLAEESEEDPVAVPTVHDTILPGSSLESEAQSTEHPDRPRVTGEHARVDPVKP